MPMNSIKGRTFTGCWPCRLKKRRCDERRPQCSLCERHRDGCCYDVKLIWLNENLHKVVRGRYITQTQLNGNKNRRRMSKEDLKSLLRRDSSPISEADEIDSISGCNSSSRSSRSSRSSTSSSDNFNGETNLNDNNNDAGSFTVSVRRLKIYDNAVESVYGKVYKRNYTQRHVNRVLDRMLDHLDVGGPHRTAKQGPFTLFDAKLGCGADGELTSPADLLPLSPVAKMQSYVDHWIDQEVATSLWLQQDPILMNERFRQLYLEHIRKSVSMEFCQSIQECFAPSFIRAHFPQWFPIALTILIASHGYTVELEAEMEDWIFECKTLEMFILPVISKAVTHSQSYQVLCHCSNLLSGCSYWPDAQLLELHATSKLVDQWKDKIIQQLCGSQDTSQSCTELKFWQAQLEKFRSIPI